MNLILTHKQPDFDALASMVAAQKLYPNSVMVVEGKPAEPVQEFLALAKDGLPLRSVKDIDPELVERVILVDTFELRRSGHMGREFANRPDVMMEVFDHHPYYGEKKAGMRIEPVGACTTLLVEQLAGLGLSLSVFEATLLALGIYDDTGSLLFENTTVRDVRAVAYLLEQGAQLGIVAKYLRRHLSPEQKLLLRELLENGKTEYFDGVPVFLSEVHSKEYVEGLALLAHSIGELEGAQTWFIAVHMENKVFLVGRSTADGMAVNEIIRVFGGSGHTSAASAAVKDAQLEDIMAKLRQEIRRRVHHPYLVRDIMSHPVKCVFPDTKLNEVEKLLLRYGHTGVPVVDDQEQLVGVISRRDVEKAIKHGLHHAPVKGFMTIEVVTVEAKASWDEAQKLMVEHNIGRLPVLENGRVVGIVTRSDILRQEHGSAVPIEAVLARQRSAAIRQDILQILENLPPEMKKILTGVRLVADAQLCPVFLVGGFVRDLLLKTPTQDLDFVVEGSGLRFAQALAEVFDSAELSPHPEFGTASLIFEDGTHFDVAGTRCEYYAFPGALPQVEESGLREDLFRRDFTLNTMAICLNQERYGELIDYYGGLRDLQQGEIRLLHRLSFIDDPTRMMRAVRFARRYDFVLTKETLNALQAALKTGVMAKLSQERFTEELMLIYAEANYGEMVRDLVELGIFRFWFEDELPWNFSLLPLNHSQADLEQRWIYSIALMSQGQISRVLSRVKLSRTLRIRTEEFGNLRDKLRFCYCISEVDRLLAGQPRWLLELLSSAPELKESVKAYLIALDHMKMQVDGKRLIQLGVKRGPMIGRILREVREAWLDGRIKTPEDEEDYLGKLERG